jgi:glycosyltransferase involved in cell wall biosynthesis
MLIGIDASRATTTYRTGTENYSLRLIRGLLQAGTEHRFRLYTQRPPTGDPFNVQCAEIRSMPFPRLWTHLRLSAEMALRPPDVLFVPAHVLPLVHPRRSVATVHDLGFLRYPEAHPPRALRYLRWSTGWNARQSAAVIADSAATKTDVVQAYGIPADKVHVVYLGGPEIAKGPSTGADSSGALDCTPAQAASVEALSRYGLADAAGKGPAPYLLYIGTLQPRKNLTRVIDAFARIVADPALAHYQLVLGGKQGWLYADLSAQVQRRGLAGRVLFPGYIPDPDLPALMRGARAFVFPSLYEGFGIPVLEAGAYGVPVITSTTSSLPEVAGDAALLVDPHDVDAIAAAMYRLVTDDALAADLARRGRENVRRFSWEKCARETLAVLESVARGK